MLKLEFDNRTFNRNYAIVYTVTQWLLVPGFILTIMGVAANCILGTSITLPDLFVNIVAVYLLISIIGFPLVSAIKKGYKNLLIKSTLSCDSNVIIFDRVMDNLWTAVGHVTEHQVSTINQVEEVKKTKFNYIIYGDIKQKTINNGRELNQKKITSIKIPIAFLNMEQYF